MSPSEAGRRAATRRRRAAIALASPELRRRVRDDNTAPIDDDGDRGPERPALRATTRQGFC
jgi:hypothetical protein